MPMRPAHRLIQLGVRSLGYDPGPIDSWWGPKTADAARSLYDEGPARSTPWAVLQLQKGIDDLGWNPGPLDGMWGHRTWKGLGRVLDADGEPKAAYSKHDDEVLDPDKPKLPVTTDRVLRQGSAGRVITTLMQHCAAVPGDWHFGKTNEEMVAAVRHMHTAPKSRGGRGWSDIGYHEVICPDGERLPGRPLSRYGAGAVGWNYGVKHVLMIEVRTIRHMKQPEDHFTPETLASMRQSIAEFGQRTRFERLLGHNEVANKLCPGHRVIDAEWTDYAVA